MKIKKLKKILVLALTLMMMVSVVPVIPTRAETIGGGQNATVVSNEKELREAFANPDVSYIKFGNSFSLGIYDAEAPLSDSIRMTPIEVNRDVTLDLNGKYITYCYSQNENLENGIFTDLSTVTSTIFDVKDCTFTITSTGIYGVGTIMYNGGYQVIDPDTQSTTECGGSVVRASNDSGDTTIIIDNGKITGYGNFPAIDLYSNGTNNTNCVVNYGCIYWQQMMGESPIDSIRLDNNSTTSLEINGGKFNIGSEKLSNYMSEGKEIIADSWDPSINKVRVADMSTGFQAMLTDGVVELPFNEETFSLAVEDYLVDQFTYGLVAMYLEKTYVGDFEYIEVTPNIDPDTGMSDYSTIEAIVIDSYGREIESHTVETVYLDSLDPTIKAKIDAISKKFSELKVTVTDEDGYSWEEGKVFLVKDMEIVNFWMNGFSSGVFDIDAITVLPNYSSDLKEIVNDSNVSFGYVASAGYDSEFLTEANGSCAFIYDDIYYGITDGAWISAQSIIYVPDGTPEADYMKVAQERINEYIGDNTTVVLKEGDSFANYVTEDGDDGDFIIQTLVEDNAALDPAKINSYYIATVNGVEHKCIIYPESDLMVEDLEYKTSDIETGIQISSTASEVPLDTQIKSKQLTSGEEYEKVMATLGVEKSVTYDMNLYSKSADKKITELKSGEFEVKLPIPADFKGMELAVYYVDGDKITEHEVTVDGDNAIFTTDHFSIYTLAEKMVCTVNGAAHKLTAVPAKAATTTAEGNKAYWVCDCGKWYSDAAGKTEITDKTTVVIPKLKETAVETTTEATTEAADATTEAKPEGSPDTGDMDSMLIMLLMLGAAVTAYAMKRRLREE